MNRGPADDDNDGSALPLVRLGWPVSNAWLLPSTPRGPLLVDCGISLLWAPIRAGLRAHGLRPADLAAVVLTHHHTDHAGNAARLRALGVRVYAHQLDARRLARATRGPRLPVAQITGRIDAPAARGMAAVENRLPAPACEAIPLQDGDLVGGLQVHWAPGHTPGSVFLYHRASRTLFTGDGLLNSLPPLAARTGLTLPFPSFTEDRARALASLAAFIDKGLPVRRLCTGHGPVRRGDVMRQVRQLLAG